MLSWLTVILTGGELTRYVPVFGHFEVLIAPKVC